MGFFDLFKLFRDGKKNDLEDEKNKEFSLPTSIDNLKKGGAIEFSFLPLLSDLSENTFTINGRMNFEIEQYCSTSIFINYAVLDSGYFLRKDNNTVEVMKEIKDIQSFLDVSGSDFNDIVYVDFETEVEETESGFPLITENQKTFELPEKFEWLNAGRYNVVQDSLVAKVDNKEIRYLRLQSMDKNNAITLFSLAGGETFIYESVLLSQSDISFF